MTRSTKIWIPPVSIKLEIDYGAIFNAFLSCVRRLRKQHGYTMTNFITEFAKYLGVDANKELSDIHRECLETRFDSNIDRLFIEAEERGIDVAEHIANECPYK